MSTKSRESIYGASVRAAAEQAAEARNTADRLACEAWNARMLGFQGPAQPSPTLGDALNAGFVYLEVKCLGCNTHQTIALDIVRRPKATPVHELERYMRCRQCSEEFGAIPISGAIWSRCGPSRSRRAIRPGRVGGELPEIFVNVRNPTLPSTLVRTISRTGNQPASRRASTVIDRAWENWPPSSDLQDQNSKHSGGRHVLTK